MVITTAKLRMAHASTHGACKPPGPKQLLWLWSAVPVMLANLKETVWEENVEIRILFQRSLSQRSRILSLCCRKFDLGHSYYQHFFKNLQVPVWKGLSRKKKIAKLNQAMIAILYSKKIIKNRMGKKAVKNHLASEFFAWLPLFWWSWILFSFCGWEN